MRGKGEEVGGGGGVRRGREDEKRGRVVRGGGGRKGGEEGGREGEGLYEMLAIFILPGLAVLGHCNGSHVLASGYIKGL